jgi:hypothetical protein
MLPWRRSAAEDSGVAGAKRGTAAGVHHGGISRRLASERGTAALEFVTAGLILLVPTVYLIVALAGIQGAELAAAGAARQAARVYVQADDEADAAAEASAAVAFALADFGLPKDAADVRVDCSPKPDACLTRLGIVSVTVRVRAPLPLVPDVLDLRRDASVTVQAASTNRVSRLWGAR